TCALPIYQKPNICDVRSAVVVLNADFKAVSGLVDLNTLGGKLYPFDVETSRQRGADLTGRGVPAVELLTHVGQDGIQPHVVHVERKKLQAPIADNAEKRRQNQKTDDRDAGLIAA